MRQSLSGSSVSWPVVVVEMGLEGVVQVAVEVWAKLGVHERRRNWP